jgi:hypothetical protein
MRFIRIAGLCLVAVFVMSMVAAGTASAAPHWLVCLEWHNSPTRYTEHQCETASGTGGWEWSEPTHTEATRTAGSLKLEAKSSLVGEIEVKCSGLDTGWIGPNGTDQTTTVTTDKCEAGTNCEKLEKTAEAVNLPWNSELKETEGKIHDTLRNGGKGEPGYEVSCKVLGKVEKNICTGPGLLVLENKDTPGNLAALLVLANFINPNNPKANCTAFSTGKETGNVSGSIAILLASGWALRVSK